MENSTIAIDSAVKIGEYVVRNNVGPSGRSRPMNEKHAGHTPTMNPAIDPAKPVLAFSGLQSKHLFLVNK